MNSPWNKEISKHINSYLSFFFKKKKINIGGKSKESKEKYKEEN